jgi:group I intron endonuclease
MYLCNQTDTGVDMKREKIRGVYLIQSKIKPYRVYVGSTNDLHGRWLLHKSKLRTKLHHTPKLQAHYNKYGKDDLMFLILDEMPMATKECLLLREQFYIDNIKPWFNSRIIAESNGGMKHSDESKEKLSIAKKGKPFTQEHKKALSEAWEERRIKFPTTEEKRQKLREINIGRKPWNTGLTKKTDERLANSAKKREGKVVKPEVAKRISDKLKGKSHSKEHNKKVSEALKNKKWTEDQIEAKRQRALKWWRDKKEKDAENAQS